MFVSEESPENSFLIPPKHSTSRPFVAKSAVSLSFAAAMLPGARLC